MPNPKPSTINAFTIGAIVILGIITIAVSLVDPGENFLTNADRR